MDLFGNTDSGANFSEDRMYRYSLWRVWDASKPAVMFIGLNPSTANEEKDDATINRVQLIAQHNGFGSVYMMNCWPFVAKEPDDLKAHLKTIDWAIGPASAINEHNLKQIAKKCSTVVFAWGGFDIVKEYGKDTYMRFMFPNPMTLKVNKDGSPKHPLYCRKDSKLIPYV